MSNPNVNNCQQLLQEGFFFSARPMPSTLEWVTMGNSTRFSHHTVCNKICVINHRFITETLCQLLWQYLYNVPSSTSLVNAETISQDDYVTFTCDSSRKKTTAPVGNSVEETSVRNRAWPHACDRLFSVRTGEVLALHMHILCYIFTYQSAFMAVNLLAFYTLT